MLLKFRSCRRFRDPRPKTLAKLANTECMGLKAVTPTFVSPMLYFVESVQLGLASSVPDRVETPAEQSPHRDFVAAQRSTCPDALMVFPTRDTVATVVVCTSGRTKYLALSLDGKYVVNLEISARTLRFTAEFLALLPQTQETTI